MRENDNSRANDKLAVKLEPVLNSCFVITKLPKREKHQQTSCVNVLEKRNKISQSGVSLTILGHFTLVFRQLLYPSWLDTLHVLELNTFYLCNLIHLLYRSIHLFCLTLLFSNRILRLLFLQLSIFVHYPASIEFTFRALSTASLN